MCSVILLVGGQEQFLYTVWDQTSDFTMTQTIFSLCFILFWPKLEVLILTFPLFLWHFTKIIKKQKQITFNPVSCILYFYVKFYLIYGLYTCKAKSIKIFSPKILKSSGNKMPKKEGKEIKKGRAESEGRIKRLTRHNN